MKFKTQVSKKFSACGCVIAQHTTNKHKKVITVTVILGGEKVTVSRGPVQESWGARLF